MFNERRAANRKNANVQANFENKPFENANSQSRSRNTNSKQLTDCNSSSNKRHHPDGNNGIRGRAFLSNNRGHGGRGGRGGNNGRSNFSKERNGWRNNDNRHNTNPRHDNKNLPIVPLTSLKPSDSRWDKHPTRLEGMSAKFAKSSGVFSSPSKNSLDKLTNENILALIEQQKVLEKLKLDRLSKQKVPGPTDSKISRRVILKDIQFDKTSPQRIHNFLESFLKSAIIPNVAYEDLELTTETSADSLIINCASSLVASLIMAFNGKHITDLNISLTIERPGDYIEVTKAPEIVQSTNNKSNHEDENKEKVVESTEIIEQIIETSTLCCVNNIPSNMTTKTFIEILSKYGKLTSAVVLLDKVSYDCCGLGFFSFDTVTLNENPMDKLLVSISNNEGWTCFPICKNQPNEYFQGVDLTLTNIRDLVDSKSLDISRHKPSSTIQLFNIISLEDVINDIKYKQVYDAFHSELSQMKGFEKMVLVKPPEDFKTYKIDDIQSEYGRIFAKFETPKDARLCLDKTCGRYFHSRLIIGGHIDDLDYQNYFNN